MARQKRQQNFSGLDLELADLPPAARWREWMLRVEAAIFASDAPVSREQLARLVGADCRLDALIDDLHAEMRARPYELAFVAGGWRLRTRPRFAEAIRTASAGALRDCGLPELTPLETLAVTAVAYLQPATRGEISALTGRDVSRDVLASLKRQELIDAALRAPLPGAPKAYVTTRRFLEVFGLASLRDLPDLERLEAEGLLQRPPAEEEVDALLGVAPDEDDEAIFEDDDARDD
jgi:segregation and condensation protein B